MKEKKKKSNVGKVFLWIVIILLCGVIVFSGFQIYEILSEYRAADVVKDDLQQFKPVAKPSDESTTEEVEEDISFAALVEKYSDIAGWLTIDDTNIDYVYAQGKNNDEYLRSTLDHEYLISGTVFLDYRSAKDLSDFNSIIFGHLMNNGTMFADIEKFQKKDYFDAHKTGTIITSDEKAYNLEVLAYLVVDSSDQIVYDPTIKSEQFIPYIKQNAINYRDLEISGNDRVVTLSTCSNLSEEARCILVAKLVEI